VRADSGKSYRCNHTQEAELELLSQPQIPLETALAAVSKIPGMNDSALALTMLALGRYDYLPIDASARERVSKVWYNGNVVTPEKSKPHSHAGTPGKA
jgi:hypothetical protein